MDGCKECEFQRLRDPHWKPPDIRPEIREVIDRMVKVGWIKPDRTKRVIGADGKAHLVPVHVILAHGLSHGELKKYPEEK